jgi:hypothetical protein
VLCAEDAGSKAWLWIGKNDFLVRRCRQVQKLQLPEATEEEIKSMLAGLRPTPPVDVKETRQKINKGRKKAADTMQDVRVVLFENKAPRGPGLNSLSVTIHPPEYRTLTQTHYGIAVNTKFSPMDFAP